MISLSFPGKIDSSQVYDLFTEVIGEVEYSNTYTAEVVRMDIFSGSKFFFRTSDRIGFFLTLFYDGTYTKVDGGRVGGGSGLFNIRMGAGDQLESKLTEGLENIARGHRD